MQKNMTIRGLTEEQLTELKLIAQSNGYGSLNEFMQDQVVEIINQNGLDAAQYVFQPIMNSVLQQLILLNKTLNENLGNIYGQTVQNGEYMLNLFELMGIDEIEDLQINNQNEGDQN